MTNLVTALRDGDRLFREASPTTYDGTLAKAADEIERLTQELAGAKILMKAALDAKNLVAEDLDRLRVGIQKHIDGGEPYDCCDVQEMRDLLNSEERDTCPKCGFEIRDHEAGELARCRTSEPEADVAPEPPKRLYSPGSGLSVRSYDQQSAEWYCLCGEPLPSADAACPKGCSRSARQVGSWVTPQQFAAEVAKRFACGTQIEQAVVDTFEHFGNRSQLKSRTEP